MYRVRLLQITICDCSNELPRHCRILTIWHGLWNRR